MGINSSQSIALLILIGQFLSGNPCPFILPPSPSSSPSLALPSSQTVSNIVCFSLACWVLTCCRPICRVHAQRAEARKSSQVRLVCPTHTPVKNLSFISSDGFCLSDTAFLSFPTLLSGAFMVQGMD